MATATVLVSRRAFFSFGAEQLEKAREAQLAPVLALRT